MHEQLASLQIKGAFELADPSPTHSAHDLRGVLPTNSGLMAVLRSSQRTLLQNVALGNLGRTSLMRRRL
jgi:hypothetical protein